ncbi:hypothetical protein JOE63_000526 [Cellulosimicrobium cellulans]|uniref:DUF5979 domain-containing protein n=1 Tax=Cellulosimicrobium cellulans TaxID=1710 RepID=UPI00195D0EA9|nr:DUF5979 domain-containing protein [Cellulosimicrobium cellulans]MBM7818049.1 hypothetical protein [Cellulosimicrobium cellulans]
MWAATGTLLLALPLVLVPTVPASAATWGIQKTELSTGPYAPGQQVQWAVSISCSDPNNTPCTPTSMTDPLPDNLDLVSASIQSGGGATNPNLVADPDSDTVTYTANSVPNGGQVQILVTAQVSEDIPYSANGVPITNTATVVSDNATQNQASDDITPVVPLVLDSTTTKTIEPEGALAAPGTPATMTIGSTNESNDPVDTLVIQDPVDPTATPNPFTYLEYVSTGTITMPPNADTVTEEYWDGDSWEPLDDSVDPATVQGVRYTFSGDIQPGATATIPVNVQQSDTVEDLTDPTTVTNDTSSFVTHPEGQSDPTTASDTYVITPPNNSVTASKSFNPATVSAGDPTTVTLGATNTGTPVTSLTVTEPAPGTPSPFEGDDPIMFTGWGTDGAGAGVQWPANATAAAVTFTCADGTTTDPIPATAPNTLPDPPGGCEVVGFSVEFTGNIVTGGAAVIPFTADTDPDQVPDDVTHPNQVSADVPNADATADADLVTLNDRLATSTDKLISPSTIPAVPGQGVIVQLPSQLLPFGPDGSTTNADQVVISDPTDPNNPDAFWDHFEATSVRSTDVPAGSTLTINYWDGSEWVEAPDCGSPITGPTTASCDLPPDAQGVQFVYDSTGDGFPPGTSFQPNFVAEFTGPEGWDDPVENCGASSASSGTVDPTEPAEGCATVDPFPVDGDGPGDFIDKTFLGEQPVSVLARSDDQVTAQITWSTGGFTGVDPMVVSDIQNPETTDVADSFYDAFDLVSVAVDDPLIQYDQVESVELFIDGAWVPASGDPCPEACDGTFPGYTLSAAEQESATSVRLTYTESPSRSTNPADPLAPAAGDGVARSTQADGRHLDLTFKVRDYKRSDSSPALGSTNGTLYNTGDPGLVNDIAEGTATFDGEEFTDADDDDVLIIDQPLNVTVTKDWSGGPISVPPPGTPAEFYPSTTVTVTGTNASNAKVDQLRLVDPADQGSGAVQTAPGTHPFDTFTLTSIALTPPEGATSTTVTLTNAQGETATFDEAAAEALAPAVLAEVVGLEVAYDGLVEPGASGSMTLTLQLRETDRYTDEPVYGDDGVIVVDENPVPNGSAATINDPGGTDQDVRLANDGADMTLQTAGIELAVGKSFDPATVVEPFHGANQSETPVVLTLTGQPLGPSRAVEMVLTDDEPQFWNQYDVVGFDPSAALVTPIDQVQVDAFTGGTFTGDADGVTVTGGDWVTGEPSGTFALPDGVDPEDVQGLRFTFTRADGAIWENPATPTQPVPIQILRRDDLRTGGPVLPDLAANAPAPGEDAPGVASNDVQGTVTGADLVVDPGTGETVPVSDDDDAAASMLYQHATNGVRIVKDFDGTVTGGTEAPDAVVPMHIAVTNTGDRAIVDPVIVDDPMPADPDGPQLRLADGVAEPFSYTLAGAAPDPANGTPMPTDAADVTVDQDGNLAGLTFTFPEGTVLEVGQTYTITVQVQFRVTLDAGTTVNNTAGVTGDRPWDECVTRLNEETGACEADSDVTTIPGAAISQSKFVKATDDDELDVIVDPAYADPAYTCTPGADGFYAYPCTPVIAPGHDETWRIRVANVGNLPLDKVVIYDRLPAPGDTGSYATGEPRDSAWAPLLTSDPPPRVINAPPGATVEYFYTTVDDYCMDDINDPVNEPVCSTDPETGWAPLTGSETPETLLTVTAIKNVITFPEDQLFRPGQFVALEASTTTPPVVPEAGDRSIAWNSAGASGVGVAQNGTEFNMLPTEGTKVGVAAASGPLAVNKVVTGEGADNAPDSFALNVQCTSAVGTWVETVLDPIPITVVPGTPTVVPNLPYGAECTITEDGTNGETELIVGTVTIDSEDPENPTTITAVNRYDLSSIEVSKEVVTDAVDQDGNPVPFGPFAVDVECTFLGADVYAEGYDAENPMTDLPIADGETIELTGLPVGSVCTVTESGTGNASSVTITVDQGLPGHPVTTDGPTTDVTLTPDVLGASTNDVTLTNTYDVGAIGLQKVVEGAGAPAYGSGPFTVTVVCTYDDDGDGPLAPRTVYDSEVVLGGAGPLTAQVANLPTGAVCDVEEVDDAGATGSVVVPDSVTVGSGDVANVVITNTFDIGTVQVDKELDGLGALYGPGPFEVTLACTYGEDAEGQPVEILVPGGAMRTFVPGQPAVYEDLPVGSECVLTETDDFGATEVTMSVDGGEPVDGTSVDVVVPPAAADGSPTTTTVTVTNTFLTAPLLLEKAVDGDAAGFAPSMPEIPPLPDLPDEPPTPEELAALIAQLEEFYAQFPLEGIPYRASISCTFQGAEIEVPGGPERPFGPGLPGVYFGLPVGAVCTVTETETGGATEVTVEPNPVQVEERVLPAPAQVVTVTNTYDAGAIEVAKVVDGDGGEAFGAGPFTVTAECTFLGEPIDVPGGAERTITGGEVAVFDGLPIGAECVVTETATGGASSTTVSASVEGGEPGAATVGADPAQVTVTNTFDAGRVVVTKQLAGPGASQHRDDEFVVTLACTWDVDGVETDVVIPGGAERTLSAADDWTAVYALVPQGATCAVSETDAGDAEAVTLTVAGGAGVTVDPEDGTPTSEEFTVPTGDAAEVDLSVTNAFRATGGGGLPPTGASVGAAAVLAVLLVGTGALMADARRRGTRTAGRD